MNRANRKRLRAAYRDKLNEAIGDALDFARAGQVSTSVDTLEKYSKLLALTESRFSSDATIGLFVALLCIAIAAVLWSYKVESTRVSLAAQTNSVQGSLTKRWEMESSMHSRKMHLEGMQALHAPNLGISINQSAGDSWIMLEGGTITLESLQIESGSLLHLASDAEQLSFFASNGRLSGRVTLLGSGVLSFGKSSGDTPIQHSYHLSVPETLDFSVSGPSEVPSRITVHDPGTWSLGRMPLASLSFAVEETRDVSESGFISGLRSGSIQFNDTSWPRRELFEREALSVGNTGSALIQIRSAGADIQVNLSGTVKDVTDGTADAKRTISPSYLEYMYNQKSLGSFWAAIILCWGTLWGVRKTIFR